MQTVIGHLPSSSSSSSLMARAADDQVFLKTDLKFKVGARRNKNKDRDRQPGKQTNKLTSKAFIQPQLQVRTNLIRRNYLFSAQ